MKVRLFRSLAAIALSFAALAAAAIAGGDYAFSSPAGWTKLSSGPNGKWVDPARREYLTLHPTIFAGNLSSFVVYTLKKEKAAHPSAHVWNNQSYAICGGHPGRYVIWSVSAGARSTIWEEMMALWGRDAYVVSYTRPQSRPPSRVARASLLSICGVEEGARSQWQSGGSAATQRAAPASRPIPAETDQPTPYAYPSLAPRYAPFIPPN